MTRLYGEPAQVHRGWIGRQEGVDGEDGPAQILWRDRLYLVREVLAHWVETTPWWQSARVRSLYDAGTALATEAPGRPALDDGEREVWRVEARAGRLAPSVVLDIALDAATGHWQVLRTHD